MIGYPAPQSWEDYEQYMDKNVKVAAIKQPLMEMGYCLPGPK